MSGSASLRCWRSSDLASGETASGTTVAIVTPGIFGRRRFFTALGGGLLLPLVFRGDILAADYVSQRVEPDRLWDGGRQLVLAYQQGETLGEACQRLEAAQDELPVKLIWRLPPAWVKVFPTIHFEVSSRQWMKYDGWRDAAQFIKYYEQFSPPPKTRDATSPFKAFAEAHALGRWSWPGKITEHLLDPEGQHRFSEYELQGLTVADKKRLHSAHHDGLIEPGRRPPPAMREPA